MAVSCFVFQVDNRRHLSRIVSFLGLKEGVHITGSHWSAMLAPSLQNVNHKYEEAQRNDTVALLQRFYDPFNRALADLVPSLATPLPTLPARVL